MESKVNVVCMIVGILGAVAAALGFAAEAKRIKASQVETDNYGCVFPRRTALGLGVGAALALLLSQMIIIFATGCGKRSKYSKFDVNWSLAKLLSSLSRIAFGFGFVLLLAGALISSRDGGMKSYGYYYECYVVKPGVFAGGAALCLASVAFGILFYITLANAKLAAPDKNNPSDNAPPPPHGANYDVEQPQIPPHKP